MILHRRLLELLPDPVVVDGGEFVRATGWTSEGRLCCYMGNPLMHTGWLLASYRNADPWLCVSVMLSASFMDAEVAVYDASVGHASVERAWHPNAKRRSPDKTYLASDHPHRNHLLPDWEARLVDGWEETFRTHGLQVGRNTLNDVEETLAREPPDTEQRCIDMIEKVRAIDSASVDRCGACQTAAACQADADAIIEDEDEDDCDHDCANCDRRRQNYVYFIRAASGAIKIGRSLNPKGRMTTLRTASPVPLELVAAFRTHPRTETFLHARFAKSRLHGEWFESTQELERLIDRIQKREPIRGGDLVR
jgi:hypothetical protein